MPAQNEIFISALTDGSAVIVPQFYLGKDVEYRTGSVSAAGYYKEIQLPALAELMHAFFTNNDYKQSVLSKRGYGEWTSTLLQDGKRIIENPENLAHRN